MLRFVNLSLRRGSNLLVENLSLLIHPGQKIGLIGANGVGKSSLFGLITGALDADSGDLIMPRRLTISHMDQEVMGTSQPAIEHVLDGDTRLRHIQAQMKAAEEHGDFARLGELHEQLDAVNGYTAVPRAEQLLHGLGFHQDELARPVSSFSGGWRIRLNLAQTLMSPSELLLLDEPTNHLDLDAIIWLGSWLREYEGTLLMVSHDREFLDEVVSDIAHMHHRTIELYRGNYSQFEILRAAKLRERQANFEKQQRQIKHMQDFVRRFRAKASKAKQAQSRLRALERMELITPAHVNSPFEFTIPNAEKTSDPLVVLEDADLGYGDVTVLKQVNLSIHAHNRIGLLGVNGIGKSTLIKSLAREIPLLEGNRTEGQHLRIGYFSQHQMDDLDANATALQHLKRLDPDVSEQRARTFLGGFGFSGDKAMEKLRTFSGGERARLTLALVTWQKPNLLLLDEPTNHLDIEMRHALTLALQDFHGAMILVSHDRYLLRNTVDQFLILSDKRVDYYEGDLEDYQSVPQTEPSTRIQPRRNARKNQKQLQSGIGSLEKRLARLGTKLEAAQHRLADSEVYKDPGRVQSLLREQLSLQSEIKLVEDEWLEKNDKLEKLA